MKIFLTLWALLLTLALGACVAQETCQKGYCYCLGTHGNRYPAQQKPNGIYYCPSPDTLTEIIL